MTYSSRIAKQSVSVAAGRAFADTASVRAARVPHGEIIEADYPTAPVDFRRTHVAVRIATDVECNDHDIQDRTRKVVSIFILAAGRRKLDDVLRKAARSARTVLLDGAGERVMLADLPLSDYMSFDEWVRLWSIGRAAHVRRRNRFESLERRRYLITLLRMALPREMSTLGKTDQELGLERTLHEPLDDWF